MADDIVTRLRVIHCAADDLTPCGTCLPCQAADEIERLRAALQCAAVMLAEDRFKPRSPVQVAKILLLLGERIDELKEPTNG